jgi:hypothetical protein
MKYLNFFSKGDCRSASQGQPGYGDYSHASGPGCESETLALNARACLETFARSLECLWNCRLHRLPVTACSFDISLSSGRTPLVFLFN